MEEEEDAVVAVVVVFVLIGCLVVESGYEGE